MRVPIRPLFRPDRSTSITPNEYDSAPKRKTVLYCTGVGGGSTLVPNVGILLMIERGSRENASLPGRAVQSTFKAGITGWAQVNGWRAIPPSPSVLSMNLYVSQITFPDLHSVYQLVFTYYGSVGNFRIQRVV